MNHPAPSRVEGLDSILELFVRLHDAEERLERWGRDLAAAYFRSLDSPPRGSLGGTRHLRIRCYRDRGRHLRRISWTMRIRATRIFKGRMMYLTRHLPEPFNRDWVYQIQKDWKHLEFYTAFDRERRAFNSLRSQVALTLRDLRFALAYKWARRAAPDEEERAVEIVAGVRRLTRWDHAAVLGALVLARELCRVEAEIGGVIEDYRAAFQGRSDVLFEPALKMRPSGTLRVYWGFPAHYRTKDGPKLFTEHIAGRPTDRLMRSIGVAERARREVGAYVKRLVPLQREYAALVAFLARRRHAVNRLLARIEARESSGTIPFGMGHLRAHLAPDNPPYDSGLERAAPE